MIVTLLLFAAWALLGAGIAVTWEPPGDAPERPIELVLRAAVAGFGAWIGASWTLALVHLFVVPALVACAVLAASGGLALLVRWRRKAAARAPITVSGAFLLVTIPTTLWVLFVMMRATIVPPANHDVIAYHLPRAILFFLDHGYAFHREIDEPRLTTFPADYELLLGNVVAVERSAAGTMIFSIVPYLGIGLVGAGFALRWWRSSLAAGATFVLVGTAPLSLLHAGTHKNDLLFSFFAAGAIYWLVPWALRGRVADAVYGIAALGLAIGTKSHGAVLGVFCAPLLVAGGLRVRRSPRTLALVAASGVVSATLLGGVAILLSLAHTGGLGLGIRDFHNTGPMYGDWSNLWRFPLAMLRAPFLADESGIWVPGYDERFWWSETDLYHSDFGAAASVAVLAAPIVEWKLGDRATRLERILSFAAIVGVAAVILPTRIRPYGFFLFTARYFLAGVPILIAWASGGLAPLAARLPERWRAAAVLGLATVLFAWSTIHVVREDASQPLDFVVSAATSDQVVRDPPTQRFHRRIGYLVDRLAGPRDPIAADVAFDTWLLPMYGEDFERPVEIIPPSHEIPANAMWVAIDRGHQEVFFTHPELVDFRASLVRKFFGHGAPGPDNYVVEDLVDKDPRFELVYRDKHANQVLYRRRATLR